MSCRHDCALPPLFPATIHNRPALSHVGYRIGDYGRFRAHLLAQLDQAPALAAWTHRGADDPGIALLECGATVGEILAFYQELYANEAFLRTASWRESVERLVALGGYRLAPGVGGAATFAVAVTGTDPVTIPVGFGFKADLEGAAKPAIFESLTATTAYPWLSRFALNRPRLGPVAIAAGDTCLELAAVDGAADLASLGRVELRAGDRLLLVPDTSQWDTGGGAFTGAQPRHEVLVVKGVETQLDRVRILLEGRVAIGRGATVQAYRVDRTFRHFGHNAPTRIGTLNETTGIMSFSPTPFERYVNLDPSATQYGPAIDFSYLAREEMPLDASVNDLALGGALIITGEIRSNETGAYTPLTVVREVGQVRQDTLTWGGLTGSATVATLTSRVITNDSINGERFDLRRVQFHEAVSPALTLRAESRWASGSFGLATTLTFFGTHAEALALAGRDLLLADAEGVVQTVRVASGSDEFDASGRETGAWLWPVRLDQPPRWPREAFDETENTITVYGNLVATDEGETQAEVALGNGDTRQLFQTFALPKAPLTYLLHNNRTPPQVPELEIHVDGVKWERVESFFGSGPLDRVYVVRQDEEGASLVQFGDGRTGARLPSGRRNVVARYRVGAGARGAAAPGKSPKATGRLQPLKTVWLPAPAAGGAGPEETAGARRAAPARLQSLGRLVGLADYEAEALALPGVRKVQAQWVAPSGVPRLRLVVLTEGANESEAQQVAAAMAAANRCRGAARFPVETVQGYRQFVALTLTAGYAADRLSEEMEPAIHAALGAAPAGEWPEEGLFGFRPRQFGQGAHVSQVIAAVQQVPGVVWVRVTALQIIPPGDPPEADPAELSVPEPAVREEAVSCPANALLTLAAPHLQLLLIQEAAAEECAP